MNYLSEPYGCIIDMDEGVYGQRNCNVVHGPYVGNGAGDR